MIGVFVRRDLPVGDQRRTGHGYSVVFVRCRNRDVLQKVKAKLEWDGLPEPFDHPYPWYGGVMDMVAVMPGNKIAPTLQFQYDIKQKRVSVGDHRFVGVYDSWELA